MFNAIEVAEWFLQEMHRFRECGFVSQELRDAEIVRKWLSNNRAGRYVTVRELLRSGPRPAHNAEYTKNLMTILQAHGWVRRLPNNTLVDGNKSKLAWQVLA